MSAQRIYYHATFDKFRSFWPLSHFGTYKAAIARIMDVLDDVHDSGNPFYDRPILVYGVRLHIQNPLITTDVYNERPYVVPDVAAHVLAKHHDKLDQDQKDAWHKLLNVTTTPRNTKKLAELLAQMGHDGLAYKNKVEDPGHMSMVNIHSDQVVMLGKPLVVAASQIYLKPKHKIFSLTESDSVDN